MDFGQKLLSQVSGRKAGYKMWEDNIPIWKPQPPVIGRGLGSSVFRIGGYTPSTGSSPATEISPATETSSAADASQNSSSEHIGPCRCAAGCACLSSAGLSRNSLALLIILRCGGFIVQLLLILACIVLGYYVFSVYMAVYNARSEKK